MNIQSDIPCYILVLNFRASISGFRLLQAILHWFSLYILGTGKDFRLIQAVFLISFTRKFQCNHWN